MTTGLSQIGLFFLNAIFTSNSGCSVAPMPGGTFFKVRGAKFTSKKLYKNSVVWISNCDVTSIEIWRHHLYTIWRSKSVVLNLFAPADR